MASILVVDDDPETAAAIADVLTGNGNEVRVAHDGQEGIRTLARWIPDLVLLDVQMPRLDGHGMVYRMHLIGGGLEVIPVVLISGSLDLPAVAARIGTPYFVAKPPSSKTLLRVLEGALSTRIPPTLAMPY